MLVSTPLHALAWRAYERNVREMVSTAFGPGQILVAGPTVDAWRALATVFDAHRYDLRASDLEGYNADTSKSDSRMHSYGIALDINWTSNPSRDTPDMRPTRYSSRETQADRAEDVRQGLADTDMTQEMIAEALAIRTNNGKQVFDWGGNWVDRKQPMHFEIVATPEDLATGISWSGAVGTFDSVGLYRSWVGGAQSNFRKAHALIEKWGGSLSRDPSVPTNRGITQNDLTLWRRQPASLEDLRNLTHDEALQIYYAGYWTAIRGDEFPLPTAEVVYNAAVSSSAKQAIVLLQEVLKKKDDLRVVINGEVDIQTIGLCQSADQQILVKDYCGKYEEYLKDQPNFNKHGKDWLSRLDELEQTALETADPLYPITEAEAIIQDRGADREKAGQDYELRKIIAFELLADELTRVRAEMKMIRHLRRSY